MVCIKRWACSCMALAAALDCSTRAAFCWVIWSRLLTAWLTWPKPSRCSFAAAVISPIRSVTRRTLATISCMLWPACPTWSAPTATVPTLASIRPLISLAASALRCARVRTSPATTAKPRPCSPARAASTAAFSARMLVWKAMPSITPMMSPILRLEALIWSMLCTTCCTTAPPRSAACTAVAASWLAWREVSADWCTVAVSCSMLAAVCSRLAAVCSVRVDRSALPLAISAAASDTSPTPLRTSDTTWRRRSAMASRAFIRWPNSSRRSVLGATFRSPPPMVAVSCTACCSGRVMFTTSQRAITTATSSNRPATPQPTMTLRWRRASARCVTTSSWSIWYCTNSSNACEYFTPMAA